MSDDLAARGVELDAWSIAFDAYDPRDEATREALCTLGNGRFATRGASSDALGSDAVHYPGCYAAGIYDALTGVVDGNSVVTEELVNLPNWLPVRFSVQGGGSFGLDGCEVLAYRVELDLARGLLSRVMRLRDAQGRCAKISERHLVHMRDSHLAALHVRFEPENWSGQLCVASSIDGAVENTNAVEHLGLPTHHLELLSATSDARALCCVRVRTLASRIELCVATRTRVQLQRRQLQTIEPARARDEAARSTLEDECMLGERDALSVEKVCALYTVRDRTCSEPLRQAIRELSDAPSFDELAHSHARAWRRLWSRSWRCCPRSCFRRCSTSWRTTRASSRAGTTSPGACWSLSSATA